MFGTLSQGYGLGLSLIVAIGAQNAYVLRQGLKRSHVFVVCAICALSDAVLIVAGVTGFGALAKAAPGFETVMRYGGALFLFGYGLLSFRNAWRGNSGLDHAGEAEQKLLPVVLTVLGFTWLNPHVYLDTVVLLGSVSSQYENRFAFGLGACLASFSFFFSLGYGARFLAPLFARPRAWQVLDVGVGLIMWAIAWKLLALHAH